VTNFCAAKSIARALSNFGPWLTHGYSLREPASADQAQFNLSVHEVIARRVKV
jgi:hypothetical protein